MRNISKCRIHILTAESFSLKMEVSRHSLHIHRSLHLAAFSEHRVVLHGDQIAFLDGGGEESFDVFDRSLVLELGKCPVSLVEANAWESGDLRLSTLLVEVHAVHAKKLDRRHFSAGICKLCLL